MVEMKGKINLTNVDTKNGFRLIRELLNKCMDDVINVKKEEISAILELIDVLEKRLDNMESNEKKAKLYDIATKLLTTSQYKKIVENIIT